VTRRRIASALAPGTFQQHFKNLEGLPWQTKPDSVLAELLRLQIRIERAEAHHCGNALAIFRHAAELTWREHTTQRR
jgi:hypothetical protein